MISDLEKANEKFLRKKLAEDGKRQKKRDEMTVQEIQERLEQIHKSTLPME